MVQLLDFLARFCAKLFEHPGFRFKDSRVGLHSAAGSWILLESEDVQIYLSNERGEISWEMRSLYDSNERNWFSFDLISLFLGRQSTVAVMNAENATFLSQKLVELIARFSKEEAAGTIGRLNALKAERARRI